MGKGGVEAVVRRFDIHEIALEIVHQVADVFRFRLLFSALQLVLVVVYAEDVGAGEAGNFDRRAPPTPQPRSTATIPGCRPSLKAM